jgi:hypothetical protein
MQPQASYAMPPQPYAAPTQVGLAARQLFTITLHRHTGMLVFMSRRRSTVRGTFEQCEAAYKSAQTHNLLFGWWGILSMFIFNWVAIFGNMSAMSQLRRSAGR